MDEKNRKRLDEALANLPQHEPDPQHWNKIEAFLDFDARLQQHLPQLPEHEPSDLLWNRIEEGLQEPQMEQQQESTKTPVTSRIIPLFRYAAAIAASVLLLLVGRYWLLQQPQQVKEKVQIAYSEELMYDEQAGTIPELPEVHKQGLAFIEQHCSNLPDVCEQPEFVELKTQLEELEKEDQQLKQDLAIFGDDPMLVQSQIKIENLRAEITKELIQLIIS